VAYNRSDIYKNDKDEVVVSVYLKNTKVINFCEPLIFQEQKHFQKEEEEKKEIKIKIETEKEYEDIKSNFFSEE